MSKQISKLSTTEILPNSHTVDTRDSENRITQTTHNYTGFKMVSAFNRTAGNLTNVTFTLQAV